MIEVTVKLKLDGPEISEGNRTHLIDRLRVEIAGTALNVLGTYYVIDDVEESPYA